MAAKTGQNVKFSEILYDSLIPDKSKSCLKSL